MAYFPRISSNNLLSSIADVITAFHSEVAAPVDFIRNQWPSKRWHSPHTVVSIISAKNDRLAFTYNSVNYVAVITAGTYRWANLMVECATKMNTAASVSVLSASYDKATKKVSIKNSHASQTCVLRCASATSTDKQRSIFPTLGYDCKADSASFTNGASATANYVSTSTWGRFEIYSSGARQNNRIYYNDGSARTATLSAGVYNLRALLAEAKYQMDSTSGVTNYGARFDEATMKWILDKGSGTFTLSTGAGSFLPTAGNFTTGSAASSFTALAVAVMNFEEIIIDCGVATQSTMWMITGHNFSAAAAVRIQANASNSWGAPSFDFAFPTITSFMINYADIESITAPNYRWYRLEISDPTNPDFYVSVGRLWAGTYITLSHNMDSGSSYGPYSRSESGKTESGNTVGNRKGQGKRGKFVFKGLTDADKANLDSTFGSIDVLNPAVFSMLPDDDSWSCYATITDHDFSMNLELNLWNTSIMVETED